MQKTSEKGKQTKPKRRKQILLVVLVIVALFLVIALLVRFLFVIKTVDVVGNDIYSDEQIEEWVLDDKYSWNTIYVMLREKFRDELEIPFVEEIQVTMISPTEIQIDVTEKERIGYVYVPSLETNAYFDADGKVIELSNDIIEGTMKISGLDISTAAVGEKIDLGGSTMGSTLLSLTQLLEKQECVPDLIYVQNNTILLCYGYLQVNLGRGTLLSEKILRMVQILPQLEDQIGTLHMETWSESSMNFYFSPGQITVISTD